MYENNSALFKELKTFVIYRLIMYRILLILIRHFTQLNTRKTIYYLPTLFHIIKVNFSVILSLYKSLKTFTD